MKNFQTEYHASVNQHRIPDELLSSTKSLMERETLKPRKNKIRWCVGVPVCALVMVCSVTVFAYNVTNGFSKSAYEPRVNQNVPSAVIKAEGNQVQKTIEKNDLIITVKNTVCGNQVMYITFDMETKNGRPLQQSIEFRSSIDEFKNASLKIGNQDYECNLFRTDDASVSNKATYEGLVSGDFTNQNGANAVFTLGGLTECVTTCEDTGFLFKNLGELYKSMTPEKINNFTKTGLFGVYENKSLIAPSWTIPAGKQHVKFSSQFSDSYIDNIGFHKTGEYGCQADMLYLSITPGNQKDAAALKKLCFQNTDTKKMFDFNDFEITGNGIEDVGFDSDNAYKKAWLVEQNRKIALNGNRIVLALDLRSDSNTLTRDCTVADLSNYRIMKNYNTQQVTLCSGDWEVPFKLHFTDTTRSFNLNKTVTANNSPVKIQKVTLSDLSLSITGKCKAGIHDLSVNGFKLIRKDGSSIDVGQKVGGGMDADGTFEFSGDLTTLVDANSITAIELWGNRIALSK